MEMQKGVEIVKKGSYETIVGYASFNHTSFKDDFKLPDGLKAEIQIEKQLKKRFERDLQGKEQFYSCETMVLI